MEAMVVALAAESANAVTHVEIVTAVATAVTIERNPRNLQTKINQLKWQRQRMLALEVWP